MKKNTHPTYRKVLFVDSASGHRFVCGSTLKTSAEEMFEGVSYPVSYVSISSSSHPFFTGSNQMVDSEGRVEKFRKRFERKPVAVKEEISELSSVPDSSPAKESAKSAKIAKKR